MKKFLVLATAAFLFTGVAFAGGDGKKCAKSKECGKNMKECKMKDQKGTKACCKKAADNAAEKAPTKKA